MKSGIVFLVCLVGALTALVADDVSPKLKIEPGRIVVPKGDQMRRPAGEIMSLDLVTRTGTLRHETSGEILPFVVLPYAWLFHHGAQGDLRDYRIGEWVTLRLHQDEKGGWTWLTYIQDDLRRMLNHREFFHVDRIDTARGHLVCTLGNTDRSFIRRAPGAFLIETDQGTRFWKAGRAATFADVKRGDQLLARLHGTGQGSRRIAWEIFMDEISAAEFSRSQGTIHSQRMVKEGIPGYVDVVGDGTVELTLFQEGHDQAATLAPGHVVKVVMAGVDRIALEPVVRGVVLKREGDRLMIEISQGTPPNFVVGGVFRLWPAP